MTPSPAPATAQASNKWRAIVYVDKKQLNLGYFASKEESEAQVNLKT